MSFEDDPDEASQHLTEPQVTGSLAESDPGQGRVGYGRFARHTPLALAVLLAFTLLGIGLYQRWPSEDPVSVSPLVGAPAPEFELTLLDGSTISLTDFRGQAVLLNFWASWCDPCLIEMPALESVDQRSAQTTVIGVGIKQDNDENARNFVTELDLTYPVGRDLAGDDDILGPIQAAYGVRNFPSTIFIAPDGNVSAVRIGQMSENEMLETLESIAQ